VNEGHERETDMATYYKVTCSRAHEMAGAGLGYEEIYGDDRYFWDEAAAAKHAEYLSGSGDLQDAYSIEERRVYADGSFDDDGDDYAWGQLMGPHAWLGERANA
jgi:hypothetical protein